MNDIDNSETIDIRIYCSLNKQVNSIYKSMQ